MSTPAFTTLIQDLAATANNEWSISIPESWMQGRTTYGGLSAALCLAAVYRDFDDLPPLRSAQINFLGPAEGELTISTSAMRRGKSVTFINAEMKSKNGLATHSVFCFGASRESKISKTFNTPPSVPDPVNSREFFRFGQAPIFTNNFDCVIAQGDRPISNSEQSEFHLWVRHKDPLANDTMALLALADMAPPAILPMFESFAPISSMTWMLNFLTDRPTTKDRWWLLNSQAEHYKDGYSSQNMQLSNTDRELIITGRQSVAGFY